MLIVALSCGLHLKVLFSAYVLEILIVDTKSIGRENRSQSPTSTDLVINPQRESEAYVNHFGKFVG